MYNQLEYDIYKNEYHLIQKKNTIESLEEPYSSEVVSYVFGSFVSKGKTKKERKEKLPKNKTRKLIIEEDSSSAEKIQANVPSKMPIISSDETITWGDENYKKAWDKLSLKHKEFLSKDPTWLQQSMDSYVINNKEFKTFKFVFPPNVIFPPKKLQDGSYNFGNELYNEINKNNPSLIAAYVGDLNKSNIPKEKADIWFKGRLEQKIYEYFYPKGSPLIGL